MQIYMEVRSALENTTFDCCISAIAVCCDACQSAKNSCCDEYQCCDLIETNISSPIQISNQSQFEIKDKHKSAKATVQNYSLFSLSDKYLGKLLRKNVLGEFQYPFLCTNRRLALLSIWRC